MNAFKNILHAVNNYTFTINTELGKRSAAIDAVKDTYVPNVLDAFTAGQNDSFMDARHKALVKLQKDIEAAKIDLDRVLVDAVRHTPNDAITTAQAYLSADIVPSKAELESMVKAANGDYLTLRTIQTLAQKHGYKVNFATVDDYRADLVELGQIPSVLEYYAPKDGIHDATQLYDCFAWQVAHATEYADKLTGKVESMEQRWASSTMPTVNQIIFNHDGSENDHDQSGAVEIPNVTDDPVRLAAEMGKQSNKNRTGIESYLI